MEKENAFGTTVPQFAAFGMMDVGLHRWTLGLFISESKGDYCIRSDGVGGCRRRTCLNNNLVRTLPIKLGSKPAGNCPIPIKTKVLAKANALGHAVDEWKPSS